MINKPGIETKSFTDKEVVIEIEHLKKSFGDSVILKDINLRVFRGETLITLGKSGSGKSVTLKCIVGLMMPTSGKVNVKENIPDLSLHELGFKEKIGFIFQSGRFMTL
jgi:phospholipid/cholesterol/gamma-HCH transport system ATP-binding protein